MRKFLKILGIILIILGILAFLSAAFWRYAYYHAMDGSAEMYMMQHRNMMISLAAGAVLEIAGLACLIPHGKH